MKLREGRYRWKYLEGLTLRPEESTFEFSKIDAQSRIRKCHTTEPRTWFSRQCEREIGRGRHRALKKNDAYQSPCYSICACLFVWSRFGIRCSYSRLENKKKQTEMLLMRSINMQIEHYQILVMCWTLRRRHLQSWFRLSEVFLYRNKIIKPFFDY